MSLVDVNGLAINAERSGDGPPVVLLHGFTGSTMTWSRVIRDIGGARTVLAVDLIGHGRSAAPEELDRYHMRRAVDDLAALLVELGLAPAVWLGYSMGARVALQAAAHRPEVVSALVLEGGTPGIAGQDERAARIAADEELANWILANGVPWFVDYWQALPMWESQSRTLSASTRAALRAERLSQRAIGLANSLRGMGAGAQEPLHERLADVPQPTLLVTGELDRKFTEIARDMAHKLPDATILEIRDAGHAAHLERAEEFSAALLDFLGRVHPLQARRGP